MFKGISPYIEIWGQVKDELNEIYFLNNILSKLDIGTKNVRTLAISHK